MTYLIGCMNQYKIAIFQAVTGPVNENSEGNNALTYNAFNKPFCLCPNRSAKADGIFYLFIY